MKFLFFILNLFNLLFPFSNIKSDTNEFITVSLDGQLGNQLFQIATAYTYALDHNLTLTIPDFRYNCNYGIINNAKRLFLSKIATFPLPCQPSLTWAEPTYQFTPIPNSKCIRLSGYFSSEKYFKHRRKEILDLFSPPQELADQIFLKYPFLQSDDLIVGVQIRDYRKEIPTGECHPTYDRSYYQKAFACFPKNTLFLITSNNPIFAKECVEGLSSNITYMDCIDYIEDFFALTFCKSFIISNSTFGWWAAWLSTSPDKKIVLPDPWFTPWLNNSFMIKDLIPEEWEYVKIGDLRG